MSCMQTYLRNKVFESKSAVEETLVGHVQNSLLNNNKGAVEPILSLLACNASSLCAFARLSNSDHFRTLIQHTQSLISSIWGVSSSGSGGGSLLYRNVNESILAQRKFVHTLSAIVISSWRSVYGCCAAKSWCFCSARFATRYLPSITLSLFRPKLDSICISIL